METLFERLTPEQLAIVEAKINVLPFAEGYYDEMVQDLKSNFYCGDLKLTTCYNLSYALLNKNNVSFTDLFSLFSEL